jgi:hypothetical protein
MIHDSWFMIQDSWFWIVWFSQDRESIRVAKILCPRFNDRPDKIMSESIQGDTIFRIYLTFPRDKAFSMLKANHAAPDI